MIEPGTAIVLSPASVAALYDFEAAARAALQFLRGRMGFDRWMYGAKRSVNEWRRVRDLAPLHGRLPFRSMSIHPAPQPEAIALELPVVELLGELLSSLLQNELNTAEATRRAEQADDSMGPSAALAEAGIPASLGVAVRVPSRGLASAWELADHEIYLEKSAKKARHPEVAVTMAGDSLVGSVPG